MFSVELYGRVRHACHVEGLSLREAARRFGIHRNTVRKMLAFAVPPGYRRRAPTGALLDRLTHHVHILEMNGESYRLKASRRRRHGDLEAATATR